jgi:hypothetical protein
MVWYFFLLSFRSTKCGRLICLVRVEVYAGIELGILRVRSWKKLLATGTQTTWLYGVIFLSKERCSNNRVVLYYIGVIIFNRWLMKYNVYLNTEIFFTTRLIYYFFGYTTHLFMINIQLPNTTICCNLFSYWLNLIDHIFEMLRTKNLIKLKLLLEFSLYIFFFD